MDPGGAPNTHSSYFYYDNTANELHIAPFSPVGNFVKTLKARYTGSPLLAAYKALDITINDPCASHTIFTLTSKTHNVVFSSTPFVIDLSTWIGESDPTNCPLYSA